MKQVVNSVPTTYTQDLASPLPVVLQAQTGSASTQYVFGMSTRPLAEYDSAWEYLLPDGLGSVRQLVDAGGNVKLAESYEPYGSVLSSQGSATSAFGFTGEQLDSYTELVFMRARYMQPGLGAFLTEDTVPMNVMQPSDGEEYLYANGNPVNYTDPSGLCVFCRHGDQVKIDARPDGIINVYEEPRSNSRIVTRLPDSYRVQVLSEPTQRGRNGWRRVGTRVQTGWIPNLKLLDNCDGPSGLFACLPVAGWNPQANGDQLFGATQYAHDACENNRNCAYGGTRGLHGGLDFSAPDESPLVWPGTGVGTARNIPPYNGDAAPNIVIEFGGQYVVFGHRREGDDGMYVQPGREIRPGQTIGESGHSNNYQHLHFGVSSNFVHYNPLDYFAIELQNQIVAHGQAYVTSHGQHVHGHHDPYSIVSFDSDAGDPVHRWFWDDCPDYTGIVFRKH